MSNTGFASLDGTLDATSFGDVLTTPLTMDGILYNKDNYDRYSFEVRPKDAKARLKELQKTHGKDGDSFPLYEDNYWKRWTLRGKLDENLDEPEYNDENRGKVMYEVTGEVKSYNIAAEGVNKATKGAYFLITNLTVQETDLEPTVEIQRKSKKKKSGSKKKGSKKAAKKGSKKAVKKAKPTAKMDTDDEDDANGSADEE